MPLTAPPAPPPADAVPRWRRSLSLGLVFLLAGPPIGGLVLWAIGMYTTFGKEDMEWYLALFLAVSLAVTMATSSYLLGAVPAFVAGCIAGWWRPLLRYWPSWPLVGLVGMVATLVFMYALLGPFSTGGELLGLLGLAAPGFVSATALAWWCRPKPPARRPAGHD